MASVEQTGNVGKKVVVVGGGVSGSYIAYLLQSDADVVLVDEKEFFEIPWSNLRAMVEPKMAERSVINHQDYFTKGRLVTSPAVNIMESDVLTADGENIPYDYLVITTGHGYPSPRTKLEKISYYQGELEKIKSANSILIVGGGPTGVELAGEIVVDFPDKKVTLVHRGPRLAEFISPGASKKVLNWLTSKKVEVILGQSVELGGSSDGTYQTSGGETIIADCHFLCTGVPLDSSWISETFLKKSMDDKGRLAVDKHLRVTGHSNIFALGDITDIPEIKQGYLAKQHAAVAAKNLKKLIKGSDESVLSTYKANTSGLAVVSLGRKEGMAQFPFVSLIGCIPGILKSKDLFVGKSRKELGLAP
uniref:FAD/NAD(P)-binding domain-containing protein n=1 Tax=Kalanchoe fedtschenkoi TaxID=63787 RepID=A0A7N0TLU3_KALFE